MRLRARREKVFGPGRQIPLDRNAKARIAVYATAWSRLHRQDGRRDPWLARAALVGAPGACVGGYAGLGVAVQRHGSAGAEDLLTASPEPHGRLCGGRCSR